MQKIIISGCSGHMGRVVESLCAADPQVQVAAGFDILGSSDRDFPVFSSPAQFSGEADAVIDFSSPAALEGLLDFARATGTPLVLATTGYTLSRWPKSAPLPWRCPFSAPPTCPWGSRYCWSW